MRRSSVEVADKACVLRSCDMSVSRELGDKIAGAIGEGEGAMRVKLVRTSIWRCCCWATSGKLVSAGKSANLSTMIPFTRSSSAVARRKPQDASTATVGTATRKVLRDSGTWFGTFTILLVVVAQSVDFGVICPHNYIINTQLKRRSS